jgi:tRNA (guanine-N7-)-methyltransferase
MRLRNVKGAKKKLRNHPEWVIADPEHHSGAWHDVFGNDHPIHLEIGCGKGQFIVGMAKTHPDINFIALEKYDSVLIRVLDKQLGAKLPNLRLIRVDARHLPSIFSEDEIHGIYLNFSDPWPKNRHAKRRLTHPRFLGRYRPMLKDGGFIEQRTDQFALFEFSLRHFVACPWLDVRKTSLDLHGDETVRHTTEFEDKFVEEGKRIFWASVIADKGDDN